VPISRFEGQRAAHVGCVAACGGPSRGAYTGDRGSGVCTGREFPTVRSISTRSNTRRPTGVERSGQPWAHA